MLNQFSRTQLLLGKESIERLQNARVAFVPSIAGLLIAGEVVKDLTSIENAKEKKANE